jgi:hypothetical protein
MIGVVDPRHVELHQIPRRPWWCARCRCAAIVDSWRAYGVCDPCADSLRQDREAQARRGKSAQGAP